MSVVQTVYMYMHGIGEEKAVEEAIIKNNTTISVLVVCVVQEEDINSNAQC